MCTSTHVTKHNLSHVSQRLLEVIDLYTWPNQDKVQFSPGLFHLVCFDETRQTKSNPFFLSDVRGEKIIFASYFTNKNTYYYNVIWTYNSWKSEITTKMYTYFTTSISYLTLRCFFVVFGRICLKIISNKTFCINRINSFLNENNQNNNDDLLDDKMTIIWILRNNYWFYRKSKVWVQYHRVKKQQLVLSLQYTSKSVA